MGVTVAVDTMNNYYNIGMDNIPDYVFSDARDAVGYEWKEYENDTYTLIDSISYVINDQLGNYYKFRFTDYFNDLGQKGYPAFEIKEIGQ
jgi:hypothetical protein